MILRTDIDVLRESMLFLGRGRESGCLGDKLDRMCALWTDRRHQGVRSSCASGAEADGYKVPRAVPCFWKYMLPVEEAQTVLEAASVQPHALSDMSRMSWTLCYRFCLSWFFDITNSKVFGGLRGGHEGFRNE